MAKALENLSKEDIASLLNMHKSFELKGYSGVISSHSKI